MKMRPHTVLRSRFKGRPFVRHVAAIAGGTVLAHAITVVVAPVLTRQYSPDAFGVFAVFSSVLMIALSIAGLRYDIAIPLPQEREEAEGLFGLALAAVLAVAGLSYIVLAAASALDLVPSALKQMGGLVWALPVGVLLGGAFQALRAWAGREGQFAAIGRTVVWQSGVRSGLQIAVGTVAAGADGLIAGLIAGHATGIRSLWKASRIPLRRVMTGLSLPLCRKYRRFPLYNASAALITTLGLNLPAIQMAEYFSNAESGFFSLSMRILGLPIVVLGQAVAQVFYPVAATREANAESSRGLVSSVATVLTATGLPAFTFLLLYGPEMFGVVFGRDWQRAGWYSAILAPMYLGGFIASPISSYALVKERQIQILLMTIVEAISRFGAIWLGVRLGSPTWSVAAFSLVGSMIYVAYIAWVMRLTGTDIFRWVASMGSLLFEYMILAMPLVLLRVWLDGRLWAVQAIVAAVVLTGFACRWGRKSVRAIGISEPAATRPVSR